MKSFDYKIRVPYGHVDRMGFLYHAHYVEYFDMARTEFIRSLGLTNLELEEQGIMLPVLKVDITYIYPAHYDDVLTIRVSLNTPVSAKIRFDYQVFNQKEELLTSGQVTLAFMDSKTKKAVRPPKQLVDLTASN